MKSPMTCSSLSLLAVALMLTSTTTSINAVNPGCFPNCQAVKPPMGWRSWNAFEDQVTQQLIIDQVDALVVRRNTVDGVLTSLLELGYNSVGMDDGWQKCGAGVNASFHDASGHAIINNTRFPSMLNMTTYAHKNSIQAYAYRNNDGCCEYGHVGPYYTNDANDLAAEGFDGVKFDNCGPGRNLTLWAEALNATGRTFLIENCNDEFPFRPTKNPDGTLDCPYHFYRTGSDNSPTWLTIIANLMQINDYLSISQPMCWAYADMLEVGGPAPWIETNCPNNQPRLSFAEAQAHFGAWCVVSSPLILGFDMSNMTEYDMWWPIISNPEAIYINQVWNGEAGHLIAQSDDTYNGPVNAGSLCEAVVNRVLPTWTVFGKSIQADAITAIALNTLDNVTQSFTITMEQLGFTTGTYTQINVRDVFARADLPPILSGSNWEVELGPRGSQFLMFTASSSSSRTVTMTSRNEDEEEKDIGEVQE